MSEQPRKVVARTQDQAVMGELLHSLSQPLTSLRCSLELSEGDAEEERQHTVSAALQQTDRVIAVVRLMREYLDTEPATVPQPPTPLGPALRSVVAELSPVAVERQVGLRLTGGCGSTVPLPEPRLRLALHYLIGILIKEQPRHRDVNLRLEQGPSESELRALAEPHLVLPVRPDPVTATLHTLQLTIATRLLESAGASLIFDQENRSGFLLRIPQVPCADAWEPLS